MRFVKAHGAGNDFVLLPDLGDALTLEAEFVRALCAPHLGLGADGVIRVAPPRARGDADVFMDYRNADGSVAQMCGNGVRCVAKYVVDRGIVAGDVVRVDTRGGVKTVTVVERHGDGCVAAVRVDMGAPVPTGARTVDVSPERLPACAPPGQGAVALAVKREVTLTTLSMGNPHAVLLVEDVTTAPVQWYGPVIERDTVFPEGTNVEFIAVLARDRVVGRIWERGVGETMASGTGASAMAAAAHLLGLADRRVSVELPGGRLHVEWDEQTLWVTGPAAEVAAGELTPEWIEGTGQR